ncbi:MAG: hypothetical protein AB9846_13910 [Tenuifilaceae bacterium]
MHKAIMTMNRHFTLITVLIMIFATAKGQFYNQKVDTTIGLDNSLYSKILFDSYQNKEMIKKIQNQIQGTWKYEGKYLDGTYVIDTTNHIIQPFNQVQVLTKSGIYEIRYGNKDTLKVKKNIYKTITFTRFANMGSYDESSFYEYDYFIDSKQFEDVTCQPMCSIGFYKRILGIKYEGHFGGEWFIPIIKLTKDTLILKENRYTKLYRRFEKQLNE